MLRPLSIFFVEAPGAEDYIGGNPVPERKTTLFLPIAVTMTQHDPASWKRNVALFLISQIFSLMGSLLVQYALMWYITLETNSGMMMTLFIICGFVPTFFLAPFAGVWADRYNRKNLIILSDGMIALSTLIMALIYLSGYRSESLLFIVAAVRAVGAAIQQPAVGAILPQMVPQEELTRVNGISNTMQSGLMFAAPIVSGILLSFTTIEMIFFIDVATAAVAIILLRYFLKVGPHTKAASQQTSSYLDDMREGIRYVREHRFLISYFVYIGIILILISPAAFLTPLQTTRNFGNDVWRLTAIEIVFSIGMMAGGMLITAWGGLKNRIYTMLIGHGIMAVCTIALCLTQNFPVYLVYMGIFGVAMPLFNTPAAVMLQEHVEESYMGRVFSVHTMLFSSLMPLGMLLFGPLADVISIDWIMIGAGIVMLVHAGILMGQRRLIEAGIPVTAVAEGGAGTPST